MNPTLHRREFLAVTCLLSLASLRPAAAADIDLFVFHRKSRKVTFREATFWILVWAAFAMGFAGLLWLLPGFGPDAAYIMRRRWD